MNNIFKEYSIKWKLPEDNIRWIYLVINQTGKRYGLTVRQLRHYGVNISPRQLKYFFIKIQLNNRLDIEKKGKPANYRELIRKES